jgi:hypothetical protein
VALGWVFDSDEIRKKMVWVKPINDRSAHQRLKAIGRLRDAILRTKKTYSTMRKRASDQYLGFAGNCH